jgi:osmoprotectant transport system substrate-binding protein
MRRVAVIVLLLAACWRDPDRAPVAIGATTNADSAILGALVAERLESAGCRVERHFGLGDSTAADTALVEGRIDAYVESQRVALLEILKKPEPESMRIETTLRPLYIDRGLFWSPPLGTGDLAVVYRRDIDRKCRAASRALMKVVSLVDEEHMERLRREQKAPVE